MAENLSACLPFWGLMLFLSSAGAPAQNMTIGVNPAAQAAAPGMISFKDLPEEVEVKALIDYLSQRLKINFIYNEAELRDKKVTIKAPVEVPVAVGLPLVEDILWTRGLAIVNADTPGFKKVVPSTQRPEGVNAAAAGQVTTQIFQLRNVDPAKAVTVIEPIVKEAGGRLLAIPDQKTLLITSYVSNINRVEKLLDLIDRAREIETRFVPVKNTEARAMAKQLEEVMNARQAAARGADAAPGAAAAGSGGGKDFRAMSDDRGNQLILIGASDSVQAAVKVAQSLDIPLGKEQNPVQSYPLANTSAKEVLDVIQSLESENGLDLGGGPVELQGAMGGVMMSPGAAANPNPGLSSLSRPPVNPIARLREDANRNNLDKDKDKAPRPRPAGISENPNRPRITADTHNNAIIVVANPEQQRVYESLIRMLDRRRPQVMIEVILIALDTSNNFELGVDFGIGAPDGKPKFLSFGSFGVGTPDTSAGGLKLPTELAGGFTGALLGAGDVDIVLHALKGNSRTKVLAAPKILINDNAEAKVESISEEPFETSVLQSGDTQRSFGGFEKAGTIVTVQPHISEDDYLQMKYSIELSSFVGKRITDGLPPARRTDQVQSEVTIPDGSTIVIGGMNSETFDESISRIPILGEIPILEYAFSSRTETKSNRTFFVFIRPAILRDRAFEDLRFVSKNDLEKAEMPADMPRSSPLMIK